MREPSDSWPELAELLRSVGADPALIGGLAVNAYRREPRLTVDVDFLVRSLDGVVERLEGEGFETVVHRDDDGRPYAVFARSPQHRVDVLLAETEFQREALDRAVDGRLRAEDLIVLKLVAWRPRDRDDVVSILRSGIDLDLDHVARWAEVWEVADRWGEALAAR